MQTKPDKSEANAEVKQAMDSFPARMKSVKDAVENIPERFPQTRNDRRRLWLFTIKYHYLPRECWKWIPDEVLDKWPSPETILQSVASGR